MKYVVGLRGTRTSAALDFGNLWHWLLSRAHDKRYKNGIVLDKALREVDAEWQEDHQGVFEKQIQEWQMSLAKTRAMWPVYREKFSGDWKRKWIGVEEPFRVDDGTSILHGIFDGFFQEKGKLWLSETKTKSQIDEFEIEDTLHLDNQVMTYLHCMRLIYNKMPAGVEYNVIRNPGTRIKATESLSDYSNRLNAEILKDEDHYFKRWRLPVTEGQLLKWRNGQLNPILYSIQDWAIGKAPHFINTKALIGKYGRCEFFDLITKGDTTGLLQRQPRKMEKDR